MTVGELKNLLDLCDDDLDVRFDADTVDWYNHASDEDPDINSGQYVEDGCTEVHFPSKSDQRNAETAYLLLKN